jgi:uncharacterized membrane protein
MPLKKYFLLNYYAPYRAFGFCQLVKHKCRATAHCHANVCGVFCLMGKSLRHVAALMLYFVGLSPLSRAWQDGKRGRQIQEKGLQDYFISSKSI